MNKEKGPGSNNLESEPERVNEGTSEIIETEQYYEFIKKCKNSDCGKEFTTKMLKNKVKKGEAEVIFAKTDECGACQNKEAIAATVELIKNRKEEGEKRDEKS